MTAFPHDTETSQVLPATTRMGPVELTVTDLDRSVAWYEQALGLHLHRREADLAAFGAGGEDVVVVVENPSAPRPRRHAGLYHYALLFPSREELARAAVRLGATGTPIQGASDHGTHEAIYLPDPDGIGIELAADRPREQWPPLQLPRGAPQPLDTGDLLRTVDGEPPVERVGPGLAVGHVHLHVGDLSESVGFYCDVIGFDVMAELPTAVFVSAGGYHHHVGMNTWRGEGAPPAPPDVVGLRHFTVVLGDKESAATVIGRVEAAGLACEHRDGGALIRDPSANALLLRD